MNDADVVVVGAGSAGCVVAERLSAAGLRVLLLEAGGSHRRFWLDVPIGYGKAFFDPRVNWMHRTEPEDALGGRRGYWPRGKVLGGSSAINAMVYVRGQPGDFDDWRDAGNPGWGYEDLLPVFRAIEDSDRPADRWRGRGGPLHVSDVARELHPLCKRFVAAGVELGFDAVDDFNGATPEGVGPFEITTRDGRRASAARAWLDRARGRATLAIETHALAARVVFEGTRAVGVAWLRDGRETVSRASRAVILCAGAIGSPAILQRSGVGDAKRLAALGIAPVVDRPAVGAHLQDHLCIDHAYRAREPTLNDELGPWPAKLRAGLRYLVARKGPLALSVNQAGGFVRSRPGLARPDLQLYFSPLSYTRGTPGVRALMRPDPFPGFLLSAQPCRPASRGRIDVASPDPRAEPRIAPGSLSAAGDLDALVAGSKLLRRLAATRALGPAIEAELAPGPAVQDDAAFAEDVRARATTVFHPVGTCRMGPDPRDAVVDARLRVHGVEGLRVVDASIFPSLTSGNTNAPAMMVGEKGAELALADLHGHGR